MSADRGGYTTRDADGFTVPSSQPIRGNGKLTNHKAGKSYTPSARSIDSIVNSIDALLNDPNVDESSRGAGGRSGAAGDNCIYPCIKDIIDKQNVIIADLSAKVSFLLSYLGLPDLSDAATSLHQSPGGGSIVPFSLEQSAGGASSFVSSNTAVKRSFADMVTASILSTKPGSTVPQAASSSSTGGGGSSTIPTPIPSTLSNTLNKEIRGVVLATAHGGLMSKDARRRNVVIGGLSSKPGVSDTALVDELLETELGYRPFIARTRSLGHILSGRVQSITVTYADVVDDAVYLIDHASLLRDSNNTSVRQFVYVNCERHDPC